MKNLLRSTIVRISALLIVVFFGVAFVSLRLQNNELKDKASLLESQIDNVQENIDELNAKLERPLDDEYIAEIAREELGLRYPQEIIFYSGEGK